MRKLYTFVLFLGAFFCTDALATDRYLFVYGSDGVIEPVRVNDVESITYSYSGGGNNAINNFYLRYDYSRSASYGISNVDKIIPGAKSKYVANINISFKSFFDKIGNANAMIFSRMAEPMLTVDVDDPSHGTAKKERISNGGWRISATAVSPYDFDYWDDNGSKLNPRDTVIYEDCTVIAIFKLARYKISYVNYDESELYCEWLEYGATTSYKGKSPVRPATAQYSYTFSGWQPDISTVTGNAVYTATYNEIVNRYTVRTEANHGIVSGGGVYEYGTVAHLIATPDNNYEFLGWSNGLSDTEIDITVVSDTSLTAFFKVLPSEVHDVDIEDTVCPHTDYTLRSGAVISVDDYTTADDVVEERISEEYVIRYNYHYYISVFEPMTSVSITPDVDEIIIGDYVEKQIAVEPSDAQYSVEWLLCGKPFDGYFPIMPYKNQNYRVVVTDICGRRIETEATTTVVWPTIFMPYESSGDNSKFLSNVEGVELLIFDRTGNMVTHTDGGWDGTVAGGRYAMPGVYFYKAILPDGDAYFGSVEVYAR